MTKEEKQLLIKDLCARLPYGVFVEYDYGDGVKRATKFHGNYLYLMMLGKLQWKDFKPYLRPLSSITDEELDTLIKSLNNLGLGRVISRDNFTVEPFGVIWFYNMRFSDCVSNIMMSTVIDFLNSIHIDHRELIEKGLALKAPEGMYNS